MEPRCDRCEFYEFEEWMGDESTDWDDPWYAMCSHSEAPDYERHDLDPPWGSKHDTAPSWCPLRKEKENAREKRRAGVGRGAG